MTFQYVQVERDGRLTVVTINRPDAMNALNAPANRELDEIFNGFAADPDQWVAIIQGAGQKAFCAGHDLKQQAAGGGIVLPPSGFGGLTARPLAKPVIAAVEGVAMGGGFEIALACDLIVAAETALFALPEPRVGLAAVAGGVHRLPREVGLKRAMGLMLTGRKVSAAEGLALGFVNEVVPQGEALAAARRWAEQILACSPMAVQATKEAALRGLSKNVYQAVQEQADYPAMAAMMASEDAIEGPRAFAERRPPDWRGR
jgi:enoyl-CoA hydratase/carnithine racemase